MNFYGYNAGGTKIYYNTKNPTVSFSVVPDADNSLTSSSLEAKTLRQELTDLGFSETEILGILKKIDNVNSLDSVASPVSHVDPITGTPSTNSKGSLVSNSAQSLKNNTEFQKATLEIEKAKLSSMNAANEIQKKHLDLLDYNLIVQSEMIGQLSSLNTNITKQIEAIKASAKASAVSVNIDTSKLAIANEKIAEGVENQISTNAKIVEKLDKQIEHYDFSKDGKETLKDSNGNVIKPREVQARKDAEQFIDQEDTNTTTMDDYLDFVQNLFGSTVGEALDATAESMGSTDGFSLAFNPFEYVDNLLKTEYETNKDNYSSSSTPTP